MASKYNYQEPLEHIIKVLVENPEEIEIRQEEDGTIINLFVKANPSDYGSIIGKRGKMINNIKNILKVKAVKDGVKININIDDDAPRPSRETENETADSEEEIIENDDVEEDKVTEEE